jgi:hypothetical protein
LLDSLAGFFGGNQAAFIGGFHSLLQDATSCLAYLDWLIANKRIDILDLTHTFTVSRISGWRKRIVVPVVSPMSSVVYARTASIGIANPGISGVLSEACCVTTSAMLLTCTTTRRVFGYTRQTSRAPYWK